VATGGWHKGFWPNTGMRDLSGDGIAMACRAGAEIGNMEFITYCANVLYEPPNCRGSLFTYIVHAIAGGALTNRGGDRFLETYDPVVFERGTKSEWDKCFVSYASAKEVRAGRGSPLGGVYYGLGEIPFDMFVEGSAAFFPNKKYKALDLTEVYARFEAGESVQVGPAAEYFIGGIVVNERFETNVEGLFAAGECTLGPFGANRVCSAITEMLVHGADAGSNAATFAAGIPAVDVDAGALAGMEAAAAAPLDRSDGLNPAKMRRALQERAHKHLGPVRSGDELTDFLRFVETVKGDQIPAFGTATDTRAYNKQWFDALEMRNLVLLLEAATRSAIARTESRGTHFREDYPDTDNDSWMVESVTRLDDGELTVNHRPVEAGGHTPPSGVLPYEEMLKRMMTEHSDIGGGH
jgi:succinate dehydrogenase/fumarate reductase flavoprotein subunit